MLTFIAQYWMQFLFGLIATGLGIACRKIYKLYKSEKHHQKTEEQKQFYSGLQDLIKEGNDESRRVDSSLQEQINIIKEGVLSIQKRNFIFTCKQLLADGHEITLQEFENLAAEHKIYNGLGGNHDGDSWFEMVKTKATNNIANEK